MTLASGVFKFSDKINPQTVAAFVYSTWGKNPDFEEITLRGCDGDRKFGVAFKYRFSGDKKDFENFLDLCIGKFTRVFKDAFVGYDVSSWTQRIKTH